MSVPEDNLMSLAVNDDAYLKTLIKPRNSVQAEGSSGENEGSEPQPQSENE